MAQKYKFSFDPWGLGLFVLVMVPNFVWFALPAPCDIMRTASQTPILEIMSQVFQVLLVAALCFIKNENIPRFTFKNPLVLGALTCLLGYFAAWGVYYGGFVPLPVILALAILPCGAFLLYGLARKNYPAAVFAALFALCHVSASVIKAL